MLGSQLEMMRGRSEAIDSNRPASGDVLVLSRKSEKQEENGSLFILRLIRSFVMYYAVLIVLLLIEHFLALWAL